MTNNELCRVTNNRVRELLLLNLFNLLHVKAGSLAIGHQDTDFTYLITTDQKLNKTQLATAKVFCDGFIAACNCL